MSAPASASHAKYAARFWSRVEIEEGPIVRADLGPCWIWCGERDARSGYGHIWADGRPRRAHRLSWSFTHGEVTREQWILHKCDVRQCVNPAHLFLGTTIENTADRHAKGRSARGERSGMAKLTAADAFGVRYAAVMAGCTHARIAAAVGIAESNVGWILCGRTWRGACPPEVSR